MPCAVGKNHLWERVFIRRDEICEEESSFGENFYPQCSSQQILDTKLSFSVT